MVNFDMEIVSYLVTQRSSPKAALRDEAKIRCRGHNIKRLAHHGHVSKSSSQVLASVPGSTATSWKQPGLRWQVPSLVQNDHKVHESWAGAWWVAVLFQDTIRLERQAVGGETPQAWRGDDLEEMKMETSNSPWQKQMFIEVDDRAKTPHHKTGPLRKWFKQF